MIKIRSICKVRGCYNFVDTEPDKTKPSCNWFRFPHGKSDESKCSQVAMYPSKECSHGLCYYHAMKQWFENQEPGREVDRL